MIYDAEKTIWGNIDNRFNLFELNRQKLTPEFVNTISEQARSVACLIESKFLTQHLDGSYSLNNVQEFTLKTRVMNGASSQIKFSDKFEKEPAYGFGTGFLATGNSIFTAFHCVSSADGLPNLEDIRVVFNFRMNGLENCKTVFQRDEVYEIKKVKEHRLVKRYEGDDDEKPLIEGIDWAWVKLKRKVIGIKPLEISMNSLSEGDSVYMLGHPGGLSVKVALKARIKNVKNGFFETTLDAFGGNSGSPVFDRNTKKVVGIFFGGPKPDYKLVLDPQTGEPRLEARRALRDDVIFEKCQLIGEIDCKLKRAWIGKDNRDRLSTNRSRIQEDDFEKDLNKLTKRVDFMNFFPFLGMMTIKPFDQIYRPSIILQRYRLILAKIIQNRISEVRKEYSANLNFTEAMAIVSLQEIAENNKSIYDTAVDQLIQEGVVASKEELTSLGLVPNPMDAPPNLDDNVNLVSLAKNMSAYYIDLEEALMFEHARIRDLSDRFSPKDIHKLIKYEKEHGMQHSKIDSKRILKIMRDENCSVVSARRKLDLEPSISSVVKSFFNEVIALTKKSWQPK